MIKRIKICDFKSIRELELDLDPVTVLIGRSGTGKSNFVQALRFLRNVLLNQESAINYEWGWERIVPAGEKTPKTSIEVKFNLPGEDREYSYQIVFGFLNHPPLQLVRERLTEGSEVVFSRSRAPGQSWQWEKVPQITTLPQQFDSPVLGKFPSLQRVVFANAALSTGIGYYHFPATALAIERQPEHGQEFLKTIEGLSDNATNYREIIRRITQDFRNPGLRKSLLASLQAVNPSIVSVELDSLTSPQKAIIGHKATGGIFELSLEQESDGLRRFYAHLLALYQTPSKLTLIFEEPENAIFPGALSLLADEFKAAPRENRGQVILTTHNPTLLDSFDVENIRAVEMQDGETKIGRIAKVQRDAIKDRLLTTGELLTVDRAKLDVSKAQEVA